MQASNLPNKIPLPFANSGAKNTIPTASQIGTTAGAASYTDGFPPLTFTPISSGGVPPMGADFNGILNAITAVQQWQSAGGIFKYDASFSSAIGGYPQGAILMNSTNSGQWISLTDNNTSNPDSGGSGWVNIVANQFNGANQSLNASGYQKLPGGFIIQWGSFTTNSSNDTAVSFPITFPNAPYSLTTGQLSVTAVAGYVGANSLTSAGFNGNGWNGSGTRQAVTGSYIAFGR